MFQIINPERSLHRHITKMVLRDSIFTRWKTVFSATLFILSFICIQQAWTAVPTEEKDALVKLYINTDGENSWNTNRGWIDHLTTDPCDDNWYGITCNAENDSVTRLILESNNLTGSLPPELGNLSQLSLLHLSFNNISGSIPAELENLNQLTELHLRVNNLSDSIPPQLGNLPNLRQLSLYGNSLSGNIPEQLGNLTTLTSLRLQQNILSGSIPIVLGNLMQLSKLHLSDNDLSGSIPPELGKLNKLTQLLLSGNSLSGDIPVELGNLDELIRLSIDGNAFTGAIPNQLGNLGNLKTLNLNSNHLSGSIPAELGNLSELSRLYLDNNRLTGSIPKQLGNLGQLTTLRLQNNSLDDAVPAELGNLSELQQLDLHINELCGVLPSTLSNLSNLTDGIGLNLNINFLVTTVDPLLDDFISQKSGSSEWKTTQSAGGLCPYPIYSNAGPGGSIAPLDETFVAVGDSLNYSITPDPGFMILEVIVDGSSQGAIPSYEFTNVEASHTISATFAAETYTISSGNDANGRIRPSGDIIVNHGESQTYTMVPDQGFQIADVVVDGNSVGVLTSYTFNSVTASHSIRASFEPFSGLFFITATTGSNGTISSPGTGSFNAGDNQKYTITPDNDYHIDDVLVDGISIGSATSYTFYNINANHSITASFGIGSYYSLSVAVAGRGTGSVVSNSGSVSCPGICGIQVGYGTSVTLEAVPENGSTFIRWSGGCTGDKTTCTLTVDKGINVTAEFYSFPWSIFIPSIISGASP